MGLLKNSCTRVSTLYSSCNKKCRSISSLQKRLLDEESQVVESMSSSPETSSSRKPGWKAMPYILGNDTVERLATFGMQSNFSVYLMRVYNMDQVFAANVINTWLAISNIVPVIGAFLADAYLGKSTTIVIGSFASLAGMVVVMLTTWVPHIHPAPCTLEQQHAGVCKGHTSLQLGFLILGLLWLSIGTGGIRPCSIPFAVDQFDSSNVEGRRGISKFFNVYYTTQTVIMLFNQTLLVYLEDSVSWTLGYGVLILFMSLSIVVFFSGTRVYSYVKPEGSILAKIAQVLVAATHKRHLHLPPIENTRLAFYDPPLDDDDQIKLAQTNEFRCLNKAALLDENELNMDESSKDPWRICSIQQVEELKCLLKIMPIWVSTIIIFLPVVQQLVFPVSQATKMDCHLGHNFKLHPGSVGVITLVTIGIFLPLYDQVIAPLLEKITKQEGGLTLLQRISIGHGFGILSMVFAGLIERRRRNLALTLGGPDGVAPMSVLWLAPQFILMAFIHVFADVGQIAFFNRESPDGMRSIVNSLLCLNISAASNISNVIVNIVHNFTGKNGQPNWLHSNINKGRLENFYFIVAGLMMMNMIYFVFCARRYSYKAIVKG